MANVIELPKLSPTMEEATLVRWLKSEGDALDKGTPIAIVQANGENEELSSDYTARLLKHLAKAGDTINLGAPIAIVGSANEDINHLVATLRSPPAKNLPVQESTALAVVPTTSLSVPGAAGEYVDHPLSEFRRVFAERLTEAYRTVPHIRLTSSVDATALLGYRKRLNRLLTREGKVTVNDLLIKGVALTLLRVPECNTAFIGNAIRHYTAVHVGVTIVSEQGLITPVIRNANLKGLGVIGAEMKALSIQAEERTLSREQLQAASFTLCNLGMYGIDDLDAIVTPPECARLTVGRILRQPVIDNSGAISVEHRMNLTLSCDQRVIDGTIALRFLKQLVTLLEGPASLAL